jgi:diguanylate cyclase (GGDEF)-like protein/PAS domain S-box-containing protein
MQDSDRRLTVLVTWLAGVLAVLVALMIPLGYFQVTYSALSSALRTTAEIRGQMVEEVVGSVPGMWMYQTLRLEEMLARHADDRMVIHAAIYDLENNVVVERGQSLPWPVMSSSVGLFDSGAEVGRLEVSRSFRGLLIETGAVAVLGVILAVLIFFLLRIVPLRVLNRVFDTLRREKERAEVTLNSIGDAVITTDAAENIEHMNPIAERLTGWLASEARGQPLSAVYRIVNEQTGEAAENPLRVALQQRSVIPLANHTVLVRRGGQLVAVENNAAPILMPDGEVIGGVLVVRDVTAARNLSHKLSWQATHDALTGLPNRLEFEQRLDDALESGRATGRQHLVFYLDLDQFKIINDTCGHSAGDELLRQIAETLRQNLRKADLLARLGGDEFGVLLLGCPLEQGQRIAENLLAAVRDFRFNWGDKVFNIGVSIGIVGLTTGGQNKEQILAAADAACYAAKEAGRDRIQVYQPEDSDMRRRQSEMDWTSRIIRAMDEDRLVLYYQEYLSLSPGAGADRHVEILLRMIDESGGVVAPGTFIPAAERYDLMPRIDKWVIETTFSRYARLAESFGGDFVCSINLSGTSLNDERLIRFIREQAAAHKVRANAVCFEITETAVINRLRNASRFILDLQAEGFRFALDDFGVGMSSFTYLRNLPVDYLKIDGSFVREVASDPINRAMVTAINEVGHVMGLRTIAEQVDSQAALEQIRSIGVDYAQGYVVAKPRPLPSTSPRAPGAGAG